ncbi:MAG: hypothetical protein M3P12_04915 [Gemmatimonadota bacterium]|nr:hypothetical protein [Gemmatimonadota bacterium]
MPTLQRSTSIAICLCAAVLAGCAKKDEAAVDTLSMMASSTTTNTMPANTMPAAAGSVNLADVAGKWNMRSVPTSGTDTSATTYVLTATGNTSGWTIKFPGRAAVPAKVRVDGDSIMIDAGPYPSVRRKGVQVLTNTVSRLQGGSLVGTTSAHYKVKTADSVLTLTNTGTRAQ